MVSKRAGKPRKSAQLLAVDYLATQFTRVKRSSDKCSFTAACPSHPDKVNSLSVTATEEGKALLKCFAGCEFDSIKKAAGLDLYYGVPIIEVYSYCDADGKLLYEVCRTADKQFPSRLPNGKGGCGKQSVLFRLPELLKAMKEYPDIPIYICEGEKDVNRCWGEKLGPATCIRGGASAEWRSEFSRQLKGRDVAILADNDPPGRQFADRIANELNGIANAIKVIEFPELPDHGDVSDFFDAGGSLDDLSDRIEEADEWTADLAPADVLPDESTSQKQTKGAAKTDLGNARLFVEKFKDDVRYCPAWQCFMVFDSKRWVRDEKRMVEVYAKQIADLRWKKAKTDEARRFALRTASARGIHSMLELVRSEQEIVIQPDQFDTDPMLLNCDNGTLDLKSGKLRPHARENYITKLCPTKFSPKAKAQLWVSTLAKIFDDDEDLIAFVQRLFGLCLTGMVTEQVIVIFVGTGSNGKSLILLALLSVVGSDYFIKASDDILLRRFAQAHPTALADLHGKRLAVVMETDAGDRMAEALIKSLTGGDRIRARRMREDFWEFTPTHKIILCTNHKPTVEATDHAFWRRIRLVPFNVSFWKDGDPGNEGRKLLKRLKADPDLGQKLAAEAEGVLAWCVRGCLQWQKHGLGTTDAVTTATESYRHEQDALNRFIEEVCEVSKSVRVASSSIYSRYRSWCDGNGERVLPQNQFKEKLLEHSTEIEFKRSNGSWFKGITLRKNK